MSTTLEKIRTSLRRARWADKVSEEALDQLLECATLRFVSRNGFVLRYRDSDHGFFCVLSGQVRLSIPATTGEEFIIYGT